MFGYGAWTDIVPFSYTPTFSVSNLTPPTQRFVARWPESLRPYLNRLSLVTFHLDRRPSFPFLPPPATPTQPSPRPPRPPRFDSNTRSQSSSSISTAIQVHQPPLPHLSAPAYTPLLSSPLRSCKAPMSPASRVVSAVVPKISQRGYDGVGEVEGGSPVRGAPLLVSAADSLCCAKPSYPTLPTTTRAGGGTANNLWPTHWRTPAEAGFISVQTQSYRRTVAFEGTEGVRSASTTRVYDCRVM